MAIKVEGLNELLRDLAGFGEAAMPALVESTKRCSQLVLAATEAKAPVLTGNLRANLKIRTAKTKNKLATASRVTFTSKAAYAVPLELGHNIVVKSRRYGHVEGRPFMRTAADERKLEVFGIQIDTINKEIERLGNV